MRVALHNSTLTRAESVTPNRRGVVRTRMIRKPSAARWPACKLQQPSYSRVDSALASGEIANTASVGGGETDTARDKASRCNGGTPKTRSYAGGVGANRPSVLAANHGNSDKDSTRLTSTRAATSVAICAFRFIMKGLDNE